MTLKVRSIEEVTPGYARKFHGATLWFEKGEVEAVGITDSIPFAIIVHDSVREFIYSGLRAELDEKTGKWSVELRRAELITERNLRGGGYD